MTPASHERVWLDRCTCTNNTCAACQERLALRAKEDYAILLHTAEMLLEDRKRDRPGCECQLKYRGRLVLCRECTKKWWSTLPPWDGEIFEEKAEREDGGEG